MPQSNDEVESLGPETDETPKPKEPGCLPAMLAGTLLMGIIGFVLCGVTTWMLFQKRTEIAVRSLEGFIPTIEQSLLDPDDKAKVIDQLEDLIKEMRAPDYPPAAAAAIMQRIVRLPMPHWGELDAVQAYVEKNFEGEKRDQAIRDLSRARRAIETNKATVFDIVDVLEPVAIVDDTPIGRALKPKLTEADVEETVQRAGLLADRAKIEDRTFPRVDMATILKRAIETAKRDGGY